MPEVLITEDSWGNELKYQPFKSNPDVSGFDFYCIASPGNDNVFEKTNLEKWQNEFDGRLRFVGFSDDIVFCNDGFIQISVSDAGDPFVFCIFILAPVVYLIIGTIGVLTTGFSQISSLTSRYFLFFSLGFSIFMIFRGISNHFDYLELSGNAQALNISVPIFIYNIFMFCFFSFLFYKSFHRCKGRDHPQRP